MTEQKVVVVTGANRNLGFAVVKLILQQHPDWIVYLTALEEANGEAAVESLKRDFGLTAYFHQLDIDKTTSVEAFRDHLAAKHPGGIDILVNNAAIFPRFTGVEWFDPKPNADETPTTLDAAKVAASIETNYFGQLRVCETLFPLLRRNARVVMVSSRLSVINFMFMHPDRQAAARSCDSVEKTTALVNEFMASDLSKLVDRQGQSWVTKPLDHDVGPSMLGRVFPYGFAKLGLNNLTKAMQKQFDADGKGMVINACCPGMVKTDMNGLGTLTCDEGADTLVYAALLPEDTQVKGAFLGERVEIDHYEIAPELKEAWNLKI